MGRSIGTGTAADKVIRAMDREDRECASPTRDAHTHYQSRDYNKCLPSLLCTYQARSDKQKDTTTPVHGKVCDHGFICQHCCSSDKSIVAKIIHLVHPFDHSNLLQLQLQLQAKYAPWTCIPHTPTFNFLVKLESPFLRKATLSHVCREGWTRPAPLPNQRRDGIRIGRIGRQAENHQRIAQGV